MRPFGVCFPIFPSGCFRNSEHPTSGPRSPVLVAKYQSSFLKRGTVLLAKYQSSFLKKKGTNTTEWTEPVEVSP